LHPWTAGLRAVGRRDFGDLGKVVITQLVLADDEFAAQIVQGAIKAELRPAQPCSTLFASMDAAARSWTPG
jgi:hypothetical protein